MKLVHRALGLLILIAALLVGGTASAQVKAPPALDGVGVDEHVGAALPLQARFTTTQGDVVRLGDLVGKGKPAILLLAYSRCSMLCNLVLRGAANTLRGLPLEPNQDFDIVTISIDPHERPEEAARNQQVALDRAGYAEQVQRWPFLVGKKSEIDAVASAIGFRYRWDERTQQFAHPAVMTVISPQGRVVSYFYGLKHDPEAVAKALRGQPAPSRLGSVAASVLSCFRFDTLTQKYGGRIRTLFQLGAATILVALVGLVLVLWRRGRAA